MKGPDKTAQQLKNLIATYSLSLYAYQSVIHAPTWSFSTQPFPSSPTSPWACADAVIFTDCRGELLLLHFRFSKTFSNLTWMAPILPKNSSHTLTIPVQKNFFKDFSENKFWDILGHYYLFFQRIFSRFFLRILKYFLQKLFWMLSSGVLRWFFMAFQLKFFQNFWKFVEKVLHLYHGVFFNSDSCRFVFDNFFNKFSRFVLLKISE